MPRLLTIPKPLELAIHPVQQKLQVHLHGAVSLPDLIVSRLYLAPLLLHHGNPAQVIKISRATTSLLILDAHNNLRWVGDRAARPSCTRHGMGLKTRTRLNSASGAFEAGHTGLSGQAEGSHHTSLHVLRYWNTSIGDVGIQQDPHKTDSGSRVSETAHPVLYYFYFIFASQHVLEAGRQARSGQQRWRGQAATKFTDQPPATRNPFFFDL